MSTLTKLTLVATALLLGLVALAHAFINVVPTTCSYPASIDALPTYQPGEVIPSAGWNKISCIVDKLMRQMRSVARQEVVCAAPVTIAASVRQPVTLTATAAITSSQLVLPQMPVDAIDPPAITLDGIDAPAGNAVTVWLFNRDADRSRTATLCASVVRP